MTYDDWKTRNRDDEQMGEIEHMECRRGMRAEIERLRAVLIDLECAFSRTSEIPETPFTLHALAAIREALFPERLAAKREK